MPQAPRRLPEHPSVEHLRKDAKRRARAEGLQLAHAQRRLAAEYGFRTWADLMGAARAAARRSPLYAAAAMADAETVRRLLRDGADPEGSPSDPGTPLWAVSGAGAAAEAKIAAAAALLDAGAFLHSDRAGEVPLHAAARTGPLAFVEFLIARGAIEWQTDRKGREPWQMAGGPDAEAIAHLLRRPVIDDPVFRDAVAAIHAGDATTLARLLDVHPRLLTERIREPECYRQAQRSQYFRDPMLVWFVADNPNLVVPMPPGLVDCAREIVRRGVAQEDLDYTLGLAMTSGPAAEAGLTVRLMDVLIRAGAQAREDAIASTLGHWQYPPIEALLAAGYPMTAAIAAGLGRDGELARLLPGATAEERQLAFGLAVINRRHGAARLCLEAGADVDGFLPVHKHSTALHQAANHDDVPMLELLVQFGARDDIPDTLWRGTALGWAEHENKPGARAFLAKLRKSRAATP